MRFKFIVLFCFFFTLAANAEKNQAAEGKGDAVIAAYDNGRLTVADFARRQPNLLSWAGLGADADQLQLAAEDIVFETLLAKEALSSGIQNRPEVQEQINKILKSAYLKQKLPMDDIEVGDSEIENYYRNNKEKFRKPDVIRLSQILAKDSAEADKIRSEANAASWDRLAAKSLDPLTARNKGSFGEATPNYLTAEIRQTAEKLEPGSISEPVKSAFGYHILKKDRAAEASYFSLTDVRKEIYDELMRQKRRQRLSKVQKELWGKYDVEIERPVIEELVRSNAENNANVDRSSSYRAKAQINQATPLQVISDLIDLGRITPERTSRSFLLANTSDRQIDISYVGSTCPCVKASAADKILKPGQVTRINFEYDPQRFNDGGNMERVVFIESNDSVEPKKYIRIRSYVDREGA